MTPPSSIHQAFEHLPDPRAHNITFPLIDLVFMALVGLVCGATTWSEIVEVCVHKKELIQDFIDVNGIPSHDTFERVFARLDPDSFSKALTDWVLSAQQHLKQKHIAADGKSSRASYSLPGATDMLHTTSLFIAQEGLFLAPALLKRRCKR